MTAKALGAALLLVTAATAQDKTPTAKFDADVIAVNLNGGLKAQLLSVGRDPVGFAGRPVITAAVTISNPGKDYAFLMFYDLASAIDDAGVKFTGERANSISGVAWCESGPPERCIGIPDLASAFPFRSYTVIDPGNSVTAHFRLTTDARESRGKSISLAVKYGYRIVKQASMENDAEVSDTQKLKQVRTGNLSFPPAPVTEK